MPRRLALLLALATLPGCLAAGSASLQPVPSDLPDDITMGEYLAARGTGNETAGSVLGALAGGVVGLLFGATIGSEIDRPGDLARGCEFCGLGGVLAGGGIGGLGGMMIGGSVGGRAGARADHGAAIEEARRRRQCTRKAAAENPPNATP